MNECKISIVIPTRDRPELLAGCLSHLAADQLPAQFEVVVADDSADASARVNATPELGEVRAVFTRGRGHAAARNAGWRAARAPIILFLDDDVRPQSGTIAKLCRALVAGHADWISANVLLRTDNNPVRSCYVAVMQGGRVNSEPVFVSTQCVATRRECLEQLHGFNEAHQRMVDYEISLRARHHGHRLRCLLDAYAEDLDPKITSRGIAGRAVFSISHLPAIWAAHGLELSRADAGVWLVCDLPFYWQREPRRVGRQLIKHVLAMPVFYDLLLQAAIMAERVNASSYPGLLRILIAVSSYKGFHVGLRRLRAAERRSLLSWLRAMQAPQKSSLVR